MASAKHEPHVTTFGALAFGVLDSNVMLRCCFLATLVLATASPAAASAADGVSSSSRTPDGDFRGWAGFGATAGRGFGGPIVGATMLRRWNMVAGGLTFEAGGMFGTRFAAAGTGGMSLRSHDGWSLDLLGALGVHVYDDIGGGPIGAPGASATLMFAGARARVAHAWGRGPSHFTLGATLGYDRDLATAQRHYTAPERGWFGGGSTGPQTIGFGTFSGTVDLGMTFDL